MKKHLLLTGLTLATVAMLCGACKQEAKQTNAADTAATETITDDVQTTIDLNTMSADTLMAFKGGDKEVYMKMFQDGDTKVMLCTLPAGASVGYHSHDNNRELILVQEGTATIVLDSTELTYTQGMVHYCPKGHAHSIHNHTDHDLTIYNIVAL